MALDTKTLKPGQQVYIAHLGSWETTYFLWTIDKITPSGRVVFVYGSNREYQKAFGPDGKQLGGSKHYPECLDDMPFEERKAWLENQEKLKAVFVLLKKVEVAPATSYRWGREGLLHEVARLSAQLAEVEKLLAETK